MKYLRVLSMGLYHANLAMQDFDNAEVEAYEAGQEEANQELFEKAEFIAVVLNDFHLKQFDIRLFQMKDAGFQNVDFSELKFIENCNHSIDSYYFQSLLSREELIQQLSLAIVLSCDATNDSDTDLSDLPIPF